jgi:predicted HTH transcriptional regulator
VDKSRIADHAEYRGHLHGAPEQAVAFVAPNLGRAAEIEGVCRIDRWEIPLLAIREAIVNPVAHADYSQRGAPIRVALFDDRLEVENPGLLPFGLTVEDLRRGISRLRNRVVGRVLHELGLMEHWGSGVQRMTTACRESGLPDPEFEEIGSRFSVTLRSTASRQEPIDELGRAVLDLLSDGEGHSTSEIAKHIGRSARATRSRLVALVAEGVVREVGTGPRDPKRRYYVGAIR